MEALQNTGLSDAGFTRHQYHLAFAIFGLVPALEQKVDFFLSADEWRQPSPQRDLEAAARVSDRVDAKDLHWVGDAFKVLRAHGLAHEHPFDQASRVVPDHHGARLGQTLQAGGDIGRLADDGHFLAVLAGANVAGHHQPRVDADAHRQLDV